MIFCRSKKVSLLCCTLLLFSAPVAFAKFHFRGGDIEDIANEIKQALETAKQSEIYLQYKQIKSDYDEMREIWGNFSSALDDLHSTVETTMAENPISRLLSTGSEITGEDVYAVFDERSLIFCITTTETQRKVVSTIWIVLMRFMRKSSRTL